MTGSHATSRMMHPSTMTFAQKLKTFRTNMKMSVHQFAEHAGITVNQIYQYESGITIPRFNSVVKIARACNCSLDYLAGFSNLIGRCPQALDPDFNPEVAHPPKRKQADKITNSQGKKLTWEDVTRIRELYRLREWNQRALAEKFGVSPASVSYIIQGVTWKDQA